MQFQIQVTIARDGTEPMLREIVTLERADATDPADPADSAGPQSVGQTVGLTLAESKDLLQRLQKIVVEEQVAAHLARARPCPHCVHPRRVKGSHPLLLRTLFGNLTLRSPRWHRCACEADAVDAGGSAGGGAATFSRGTFSPLASLLPEHVSPELLYLETKWASLVSFETTRRLLHQALPVDERLSAVTIRNHAYRVAARCEAALGPEQGIYIGGCPRDWHQEPLPDGPLTVGLDGGYVRARKPSRYPPKGDMPAETPGKPAPPIQTPTWGDPAQTCSKPGADGAACGWIEVITGKSILAFRRDEGGEDGEDCTENSAEIGSPDPSRVKRFALVRTVDERPKRRLYKTLRSQGLQPSQQVTFLSDGGEGVRELPAYLSRESEHWLDWFHVTMRLTVLSQCARGLDRVKRPLLAPPVRPVTPGDEEEPEEGEEPEVLVAADAEPLPCLVERVKHYLWHGNVRRALDAAEDIELRLLAMGEADLPATLREGIARMERHQREFAAYIENNAGYIPNYGERYRSGERISTAFAESTVNEVVSRRFVKKQQMQWTPEGAHLLLQTRVKVLNDELEETFRAWYPGFRPLPADASPPGPTPISATLSAPPMAA